MNYENQNAGLEDFKKTLLSRKPDEWDSSWKFCSRKTTWCLRLVRLIFPARKYRV